MILGPTFAELLSWALCELTGGNSVELGTVMYGIYPPHSRRLARSTMGLNIRRKIIGDRVSPWKMPLLKGKVGVDQSFVSTNPSSDE